jgi:hypothetical protein
MMASFQEAKPHLSLGGEVAPLGAGEGAFFQIGASQRPPHPSLRADLSPKGRGEDSHRSVDLILRLSKDEVVSPISSIHLSA